MCRRRSRDSQGRISCKLICACETTCRLGGRRHRVYAAAVLDLYSRRVVGWSMQDSMTSQLVADALMMAVWRRGKPVALLHHSDQGSQYTSEHFQELLKEQGITCSMSRAGEVWDNSAMESFFSSLKTERTACKVYRTRAQARAVRESSRSLGRCPRDRQQSSGVAEPCMLLARRERRL